MSLDAFLAKFNGPIGSTQLKDLSELHGVLWEHDDNVSKCRNCSTVFSMTRRRHHCRGCGGVFCEACLTANVTVPNRREPLDRACVGCCEGLTPGEVVISKAEAALKQGPLAVRGSGAKKFPPGECIAIVKGAKYDRPNPAVPAPTAGYFEFVNKTKYSVGIKLLEGGSNYIWEAPRPSYVVVAPNESVNATFNPDCKTIDIILLTNNPTVPPEAEIYSESVKSRSAWAQIDKFRDFVIYQADSQGHNVMIKYKGSGVCELRAGTSLSRNGLVGLITGSIPVGQVDFETNCPCIERVFTSMD